MTQACGFVTILGIPNVGKSTLTNALVGSKVSIVSPKVQTTRRRVLGIALSNEAQIVLIDTPGIFVPKKRLDRAMVSAAWENISDTDVLMVMADASHRHQDDTLKILDRALQQSDAPVFLVINKIDLIDRKKLLELITQMTEGRNIAQVFLISAQKKDGIPLLLKALEQAMPEQPWMYPEDQLTDMPMRLLSAEITREHIFRSLHQELPYSIHVETEAWENFDNGSVKISQVIHVEKDGQKRILLGKGGHQIKYIRETAVKEIQEILGQQVHLFLHVKVSENWSEQRQHYTDLNLNFDA
ncbi:MAG: GTPase Era [Janthinobacterium lividum]